MLRRAGNAALAICVILLGTLSMPSRISAQSSALVNVLSEIQQVNDRNFQTLCTWARNGASAPFNNYFQPEKTESDILGLGDKDRQAVLWWLQGNGRSGLYSRGASDYQIGPRRAPADKSATPAPSDWRQITLATATLGGSIQGPVQVLGGFAGVKRDGTAAIACVSFKNVGTQTMKRVDFRFSLLDEAGDDLGDLVLERAGEFSVQTPIMTYDTFSTWSQGSIGPRGYNDNCIKRVLPTPAVPLLRARTAAYYVTNVVYDDGTTWTPGMATPH